MLRYKLQFYIFNSIHKTVDVRTCIFVHLDLVIVIYNLIISTLILVLLMYRLFNTLLLYLFVIYE